MNRRKFLTMFAMGSVGMTAADKLGYLEELKNWVLSPSKTIFIPSEPKIEVARTFGFGSVGVMYYAWLPEGKDGLWGVTTEPLFPTGKYLGPPFPWEGEGILSKKG